MARKLTTYVVSDGWARTIVATTTKKAAAEAMGISAYHLNTYGWDTNNKAQLVVAESEPGQAFTQANRFYGRDWWRTNQHNGYPKSWEERDPDIRLCPVHSEIKGPTGHWILTEPYFDTWCDLA